MQVLHNITQYKNIFILDKPQRKQVPVRQRRGKHYKLKSKTT